MSTMETLLDEVKQAPPAMLEEVLDFVRFLKSGRYAPLLVHANATPDEEADVIFDKPRTLSDLADEQRAFLASLALPLVDVELPSEE